MTDVLVFLGAYVLGAIPFGYILYRVKSGRDIRTEGSGNIGATNVMRRAGLRAGLVTLALDFGKGFLAIVLVNWLTGGSREALGIAAFAAIAGHIFPVFLKFRGGKGVATGCGVFARLAPYSVLLALLIFLVLLWIFRYVSLGSIIAIACLPPLITFVDQPGNAIVLGAVAGAVLIIARHLSNIKRLLAGTENRLQFKRT